MVRFTLTQVEDGKRKKGPYFCMILDLLKIKMLRLLKQVRNYFYYWFSLHLFDISLYINV